MFTRSRKQKRVAENYTQLCRMVNQTIDKPIFDSMKKYLHPIENDLWGDKKPRTFLDSVLYMTLYHDLENVGFCRIKDIVHRTHGYAPNTIDHNTRLVREQLREWAKTEEIKLGDVRDWNAAARNLGNMPEFLQKVNLFIDSSDFHLTKTKDRTPESDYWSGKDNCPGWRFMFLQNSRAEILKVWGGYSPKRYDAHFVDVHSNWFEDFCSGGVIIADMHFASVRMTPKMPKFITERDDKHDNEEDGENEDAENEKVVTKTATKRSKRVGNVRGRVERPFSQVKKIFKSLAKPWAEDEHQLSNTVFYACGVVNAMRRLDRE